MGLASLDGRAFRLDPTSVSWTFEVHTNKVQTVGGSVVQVFGATLGDLLVTGSFGKGGWREQAQFLRRMKDLAEQQVRDSARRNQGSPPMRFLYPPKKWDFLVYLKGFVQPGGQSSVVLENRVVAPQWALTLFIVEDNSGLREITKDIFINRLRKGLGWKKTDKYSGPLTYEEVQQYAAGQGHSSPEEFLLKSYGVAEDTPAGGTG